MRIKALEPINHGGCTVPPGEVIDVHHSAAEQLVSDGAAELDRNTPGQAFAPAVQVPYRRFRWLSNRLGI